MVQSQQEKLVTQLETQYQSIDKRLGSIEDKLDKKPDRESVSDMIHIGINEQFKECSAVTNKKTTVPPRPYISPKGWDTVKYIATLLAVGLIGGGSGTVLEKLL